jgi:tetratricopeptide (TPR) repeat protein
LPTSQLDLFREALGRPERGEPEDLRASADAAAAHLAIYNGDPATARSYIEDGLVIAKKIGDIGIEADLLDLAAWIAYRRGDLDQASPLIDKAANLVGRGDTRGLQGRVLYHRAAIRGSADPEGSRADFVDAISYFRAMGDLDGALNCLGALGYHALLGGDLQAARAQLEEARAAAQDCSSFSFLGNTTCLGLIAIMEGDVGSASDLYAESLRLLHKFGDTWWVSYSLLGVGLCLTAFGDPRCAAEIHGAADAVLDGIDFAYEPIEAELRAQDLARLRHTLGETAFDSAYQAGRRLSSLQAIELGQLSLQRVGKCLS